MGIDPKAKVVVTAKIQNREDLYMVKKGYLPSKQARDLEVTDALVDTGATALSMPRNLIERLGLGPVRTRQARTAAGVRPVQVYEAVRVTIQGRECLSEVTELPDGCPVLIGQVPLELLAFVVDPPAQRLIGNPDHGGEHMIDLF